MQGLISILIVNCEADGNPKLNNIIKFKTKHGNIPLNIWNKYDWFIIIIIITFVYKTNCLTKSAMAVVWGWN
jgi:hypothetical protein